MRGSSTSFQLVVASVTKGALLRISRKSKEREGCIGIREWLSLSTSFPPFGTSQGMECLRNTALLKNFSSKLSKESGAVNPLCLALKNMPLYGIRMSQGSLWGIGPEGWAEDQILGSFGQVSHLFTIGRCVQINIDKKYRNQEIVILYLGRH